MHRAGPDRPALWLRGGIAFQSHPAFRAVTRLVGFDAGTHRAVIGSVGFVCGSLGIFVRVVGALHLCVIRSTTAGRFGFTFVMVVSMTFMGIRNLDSSIEKLRPAEVGAKIVRAAIPLRHERFGFVHLHAAYGINGHDQLSLSMVDGSHRRNAVK
jgi:hypothetical protein